ncbi:MAG: CRTAC1 family protein [Balneolaceae bacterium]|nr:CRTAC1 family protein [Balneolaceae bacterium]
MIFSFRSASYSISLSLIGLLLVITACQPGESPDRERLFRTVDSTESGITFSNDLTFRQEFNIYRYRNFYNGGGVAIGDINNDGLQDLFFTSNMEDNKLYLNQGGLTFRDITDSAGVSGTRAWSTGVSMADVNGDGLLDIYVCNSGIIEGDDKQNELFINNGDLSFSERAEEFGIADSALSIHGSFFDYDRDGDLDLYLVNNSYRAIGSFDLQENIRGVRNARGGDKLFRNDGGTFTDVSEETGIYGSEIGFGLGVSVADLNRDGWPDMYISNDFFERDYLYINNMDGTFSEVLEEQVNSVSAASMGADVADLNGDGYAEIFVTDMLPEPESRVKKVTTFDSWERYQNYLKNGYFHQFTRNTLQLNNGNGTYSEIGRWAGVEATDWSWGANIADFDLDGRRDLFVANGIYQDITNLDYLQKISQEEVVRRIVKDNNVNFRELIDMIPSTPISNYAFRNTGNLQFADSAASWGLDDPGFSNGSAYGDLDNDGDLELVINNLNSVASLYENRAAEQHPGNHWLMLQLESSGDNTNMLGAQVTAWAGDQSWYAEQMPIRGFQSTMDPRVHIGLGSVTRLDSLLIEWPDNKKTLLRGIDADTLLTIRKERAAANGDHVTRPNNRTGNSRRPYLRDVTEQYSTGWKHIENEFVDFNRDLLLFHMRSTEGPAACIGDANGDGRDDMYVGGAKDQAGVLLIQTPSGGMTKRVPDLFEADKISEDTDCAWFDGDGDGDQDLYVTSGGNEFPTSSSALSDRYYINDGSPGFRKSEQILPTGRYESTGTVAPHDIDSDGDMDLFVGTRLRPFAIGVPVDGYILKNDGNGNFTEVTENVAPGLLDLGMISDAAWGDMDGDGDADLLIAGEWMPLTLFINEEGILEPAEQFGLSGTGGWWNSLRLEDLDGDGDLDFTGGNHGQNSRFHASGKEPVHLWTGDFDSNGTIENVIGIHKNDEVYPMALRHNLIERIPSLEQKYPDYESFAGQSIRQIFTTKQLEDAHHSRAYMLESVIGWNRGDGSFNIEKLPMEAQLSPMYGINTDDINGDGHKEILTGGNLHNVKPEVGRYDASYGAVITARADSSVFLPPAVSGFQVEGEVRRIMKLQRPGSTPLYVVIRNDDTIKYFEMSTR